MVSRKGLQMSKKWMMLATKEVRVHEVRVHKVRVHEVLACSSSIPRANKEVRA
jgi:hypothetical protein